MLNWAKTCGLILLLALTGCSSTLEEQAVNVTDPLAAAKTRISLGLSYLEAENYKQAKFNLDKALDFAPRYANVHYGLAYYYQQVDELNKARESYATAVGLAPNDPEIANAYGSFLCTQGEYAEATTRFMQAINNQSYLATAETYENLALCATSQGESKVAIGYLQKALNHQPNRAKSHFLLAELYFADQQYNQALKSLGQFERVSGITPDSVYMTYKIAEAQNNTKSMQAWAKMLQTRFPQHPHAKATKDVLSQTSTSAITSRTNNDAATQKSVRKLTPNFSNYKRHILAKGETLFRLSVKYRVTVQDLIDWNDLSDINRLKVGQSLIVGPQD
jgi:type IV pilus assembly protein PilF